MKRKILYSLLLSICVLAVPIQTNAAESECNHQWGEWLGTPADCGYSGYQYRYCDICGESEEKVTDPTGNHTWSEWFLWDEPECFSNGRQIRYCEVCNESQFGTIPAYGKHTWTDWKVTDKPTCGYTGEEERECTVCGTTQEKAIAKDPNNHEILDSAYYTDVEATALKAGKKVAYCDCGKIKKTKVIPKLKAKVTLTKKTASIKKGKKLTLKVKSKTKGDKIAKWSTSNKKVAAVTSKGVVKGVKKGTATITLKMKSGAKVSCKIKVK